MRYAIGLFFIARRNTNARLASESLGERVNICSMVKLVLTLSNRRRIEDLPSATFGNETSAIFTAESSAVNCEEDIKSGIDCNQCEVTI